MLKLRSFLALALLASLFAVGASASVTFDWKTAGNFQSVWAGLDYNAISQSQSANFTLAPGQSHEIALGSFALDEQYYSNFTDTGDFTLTLTFFAPPIGASSYESDVTVTGRTGPWCWIFPCGENDTAKIDFDNTPHTLAYAGGTFDLVINDVDLNCPSTPLTGTITLAAVPEPGSIILLGTLLSGIGLYIRKRRS